MVPVDLSITDELDRSFTEKEWSQSLDSFFTIAFRRIVSPPLAQRAALKPESSHKAITSPVHRFIDTRTWNPEDVKHIADLPLCPTLFQERIQGPGDVRVTVVGTQIFSAYLSGRPGVVDSRLDAESTFSPHKLPRDLESTIVRLMNKLGLDFGTIDLKLADNGEYVFLEVNPQGQFLYIEIRTGLPISTALADFLAV